MIKTSGGQDPAAAPSVLDLRNPARRRRRARRRLDLQQARSAPGRRCCRASKPARGCRCSARSAVRSSRSIRRPKRGWSRAASASRRSSRWPPRSRRADTRTTLFYGARPRRRALLRRAVRGARRHRRARAPRTAAAACTDASPCRSEPRSKERPLGNPVKLYVCGPTPMMRACAQLAGAHGRACDVSLEQVMGCGLGGCYSCVVLAARRRRRRAAPHAHLHRGPRVRRPARRLGRGGGTLMDLSLQDRIAHARQSADRRERLLRLRRRVRRRRGSVVARRRRRQGAVPRRARRAPAAADRRNAVRDAERDRPAGHRRAPLHRRAAAGTARAPRDRHRQHLRDDARRVRRGGAHPVRRRRRPRARAEHLLPEHQGRGHHVRLQPARARTTSSARSAR